MSREAINYRANRSTKGVEMSSQRWLPRAASGCGTVYQVTTIFHNRPKTDALRAHDAEVYQQLLDSLQILFCVQVLYWRMGESGFMLILFAPATAPDAEDTDQKAASNSRICSADAVARSALRHHGSRIPRRHRSPHWKRRSSGCHIAMHNRKAVFHRKNYCRQVNWHPPPSCPNRLPDEKSP